MSSISKTYAEFRAQGEKLNQAEINAITQSVPRNAAIRNIIGRGGRHFDGPKLLRKLTDEEMYVHLANAGYSFFSGNTTNKNLFLFAIGIGISFIFTVENIEKFEFYITAPEVAPFAKNLKMCEKVSLGGKKSCVVFVEPDPVRQEVIRKAVDVAAKDLNDNILKINASVTCPRVAVLYFMYLYAQLTDDYKFNFDVKADEISKAIDKKSGAQAQFAVKLFDYAMKYYSKNIL